MDSQVKTYWISVYSNSITMQTVDGQSPAKSVSLSGTDRITKLLWSFRMGRWLGFARNNQKRLGMIRPSHPENKNQILVNKKL